MKYSQMFAKTRKTVPNDATAKNHKLLLQAGYIDQLSAGIFSWLPLGLRVLTCIETIIREELDAIGAQEILMPTLVPKTNWEQGKRWEGVDVLFKTKSQTGKEYGLGFSHEEVVTPLAAQYIHSYKDLPLSLYQIQTKFRDELRAKSGVLRGREFGMKDMYSFHATVEEFSAYYELVKKTYMKIFARMGLNDVKITEASGGSFTKKHSHEFNVLTPAGEVDLLYCPACTFAENQELDIHKNGQKCSNCSQGTLTMGKAIEVGNIFDLGTKFSENFSVKFTDKDGSQKIATMGCYGIGTTRLVGTIAELFSDERGLVWPDTVAPAKVHLVSLPGGKETAEKVYKQLEAFHIAVVWDDREDVSAGVKFSEADLLGLPYRFIVSSKTDGKVEVKKRIEKTGTVVSVAEALALLS